MSKFDPQTTPFIITCGHETTRYSRKELWSCSASQVTIFTDKNMARNAIRTTIRRRQRMIANGEIDEDDRWGRRQCYRFHYLEKAEIDDLHRLQDVINGR